jgi:hypothetical protein
LNQKRRKTRNKTKHNNGVKEVKEERRMRTEKKTIHTSFFDLKVSLKKEKSEIF